MHFVYLCIMKTKTLLTLIAILALLSCHDIDEHKTVVCIPVYGQSLALGIDATRLTDLDTLSRYADGRIVTENMDHRFGYFDLNGFKQSVKRMIHYDKHPHEISVYSMAEYLADHTGKDTLICIFPGGQDGTIIANLGKGSAPYQKFISDIETAYQSAKDKGWDFVIPALCWMQGETDINSYPGTDYRELLLQFFDDINQDIKRITGQKKDIEIICYQANILTRAPHFDALSYDCTEASVPQTQMELVRDHPSFHASGPTYPYDCVNDIIHIDGWGQRTHGRLAALAALDIIRHQENRRGLLPMKATYQDQEIIIDFSIPHPPLVFDTVLVAKTANYGFSVITPDNRNIARDISIQDHSIHISCSEQPEACRIRYAVNGEKMKSGRQHGPRGNLRDSQGDLYTMTFQGKVMPIYNWCYQFDMPIEKASK